MDPLSLEWGAATAEFQNDDAKSAVDRFTGAKELQDDLTLLLLRRR